MLPPLWHRLQLGLGLSPWLGTSICHRYGHKKKKKKKDVLDVFAMFIVPGSVDEFVKFLFIIRE